LIIWSKNGVEMKNRDYFILMIISLVLGFIVVEITTSKYSFSDEYYKKEIQSYPYEHSKIPTDGK
jgi:hypothetical protein